MSITFQETFSAATDLSMFTSTVGTVAVSTTQAHSDTKSMKCTAASDGQAGRAQKTAVLNGASGGGNRINIWLYLQDASAGDQRIFEIGDTGNGQAFYVGFNSSQVPTIFNSAVTAIISSGSAVS